MSDTFLVERLAYQNMSSRSLPKSIDGSFVVTIVDVDVDNGEVILVGKSPVGKDVTMVVQYPKGMSPKESTLGNRWRIDWELI